MVRCGRILPHEHMEEVIGETVMDLIREIEKEYMKENAPQFEVGDSVKVWVKVVEGDRKSVV